MLELLSISHCLEKMFFPLYVDVFFLNIPAGLYVVDCRITSLWSQNELLPCPQYGHTSSPWNISSVESRLWQSVHTSNAYHLLTTILLLNLIILNFYRIWFIQPHFIIYIVKVWSGELSFFIHIQKVFTY